jgi:acyl-coenzyme A thioesterase PaaI-like protein
MVVFYLELYQRQNMNLNLQLMKIILNAASITHGGYLSALIDAGAGTAGSQS